MIFFTKNPPNLSQLRQAIVNSYQADETECVSHLINALQFSEPTQQAVTKLAKQLVEAVRSQRAEKSGIEAFMLHYDLSTEEGIMLMCLAEALLRIPDKETESLLIRDKLTSAN